MVLGGTPEEAIYTDRKGNLKVKGYSTFGGKTTISGSKNKRGGGFGLKRMIGGTADMLTGNLFDFDKRSGGGLLRKTASAVGGLFGGRDKTQKTKSSGNIRPSQDPNSLRYKQIQALRNSAEGNMNKGPITTVSYTHLTLPTTPYV